MALVSLLADAQLFALRDPFGANALHYGAICPNPMMLPALLERLPADAQQRRAILDLGRNDGRTPLMQAAISNRAAAVTVLLRAGAALDRVDRNGDTALHKSARSGALDLGRLLLARDADLALRNHQQQTPLATARCYGQPDFALLLLSCGARE